MKKIIMKLLLACVLAAGAIAVPVGMETVQAAEWDYEPQEDGTIEITRYEGDEKETTVKIPGSLTIKGEEKKVTRIGDDAFQNCKNLVSIEIPSGVTSIGEYAFLGCSSLTSVKIPDGMTVIEDSAFQECSSLASIELPNSVTDIGYNAFADCSSLTSIEIPNKVTSIKNSTFFRCKSLTSIRIPNSVTDIDAGAFNGCGSLVSIEIPNSVASINSTFWACSKLEKIVVEGSNPYYESDDAGVLYNKGKTTLISYPRGKKETSIVIPESVISIGKEAFRNCSNLVNISIPSSVASIGEMAFLDCTSLTSIELPSGLTSIEYELFGGCSSLTSIGIPSSVTNIGILAFSDCSSLTDIYYGGSQEQWNAITVDWRYGKNDILKSATIHYNSVMSGNPQPGDTPQTPEQSQQPQQPETPQKSDQTITAQNITKTYGAKPFSLNAKVNTGTALTYAVSDKKVATVDKKGKVTIKGCGITNITITAPGTDTYNQAKKTIKLTVKPKKVTLSSVKSTKKKTATVKWKQDKKAAGYLIQCATDSKFKKNKVQMTVSKNKTVSATVKKLKAGKKYYVRVCAYAKSGKTKVQGDWSKVKTVKVKK